MNIEQWKQFLDSLEPEKGLSEVCEACSGDGKETCNNPDHGFYNGINESDGVHGCPVCGNDPDHKVPNGGYCATCKGTGIISGRGLPEEMHGWRFDEPLEVVCNGRDRMSAENFKAFMIERCRRAESRQIPDIKERVKEFVRYAMDATRDECCADTESQYDKAKQVTESLRTLCTPEVKP